MTLKSTSFFIKLFLLYIGIKMKTKFIQIPLFIVVATIATLIHELGHALAILLSGGQIVAIEFGPLDGVIYFTGAHSTELIRLLGGLCQYIFFTIVAAKWGEYYISVVGTWIYMFGEMTELVIIMTIGWYVIAITFAVIGVMYVTKFQ